MLITVPCTFSRRPSESDLAKIRADAGNPELTLEDVIVFGKSLIARSDLPGNRILFPAETLKHAAHTFVGKAINLDHQYEQAAKQVARIFDAWTEDAAGATYLYVNSYAVRTADLADVHTRMFNRQHREMSMGANIRQAVCSVCNKDVMPHKGKCPEHFAQADCVTVVQDFEGEHVSFVGDPAIEGAQLLNSKQPTPAPQPAQTELLKLAADGELLRNWASQEFAHWFQRNNPTIAADDIKTLADKLTAKEMLTFARVERSRLIDGVPPGAQQLQAPPDDESAKEPLRTAEEIRQSLRKGKAI
jgi:hypothetical protein